MDEKLRQVATGLRRLREHVIRGSATPGQVGQALGISAAELDRLAEILRDRRIDDEQVAEREEG